MKLLKDKRALVCGSSQGIGKAVAGRFSDQGAEVILVARTEAALKAVCERLSREEGQQHAFFVADFNSPQQLQQALERNRERIGPIHILVNNSGGPPGGLVHEAAVEEFLEAFSRHLIGNQLLVRFVLDDMKQAAFGRIINIISTSVKEPIPGLGVSNTIRGAVASWSKTLADELAPFGITVNNILPGYTATARLTSLFQAKAQRLNEPFEKIVENARCSIPMGRFGKPEEIADAALFLASDLASYVSGINLPVDGGRTRSL